VQVTVARNIALVVLFSSLLHPSGSCEDLKRGVVVENVAPHLEADKAGLKQGDIILHWTRGDSRGEIDSPFDMSAIEIEQAPRGNVTLAGLRGTEERAWPVGGSKWGISARPQMSDSVLSTYREGQEFVKAGKFAEAAEKWRTAADQAKDARALWFLYQIASMWVDERRWDEADKAYQQAVEAATDEGPVVRTQLLSSWGNTYRNRSDWNNAEACYQRSVAEAQRLSSENLILAKGHYDLGQIFNERGDLEKAENYYRNALEIREKIAPGSLDVAASLNSLGNTALNRGDLAKAEEYFRQALAIREKLAPASLDVGTSFNNLGLLAWTRGDLAKAEEYHRQALDIFQKLAPGSLDVARSLGNLGLVARKRGDLAKAEEYIRQTLDIFQKLAPGSLWVARSFDNLGTVAFEQGNLAKADEYFRQALGVRQKLAPGSLHVAASFNNLGLLAWTRGDLAKAEEYHRQALDIHQKLAPGSLDVARSLNNLGILATARGDLAQAEALHSQALALQQVLAPGATGVAITLSNLGEVAARRGDFTKAEAYYRRSLQILPPRSAQVSGVLNNLGDVARNHDDLAKAETYYRQSLALQQQLSQEDMSTGDVYNSLAEISLDRGDLARAEEYCDKALSIRGKLAPGSTAHAESLVCLATVMRRKGQLDSSAQLYDQALNAFESQTARLGGAEETRSNFRASHSNYFADYIDLLMREKKHDLAFYVAERWRARSLLETLAGARVDIRQGIDPSLRESDRSLQESLRAKSDRRIKLLTAQPVDEKQVDGVEKEIADLRSQYSDMLGRIRTTSPVYAALTQPQPLNASEVQQLLDDDTLLLEYALGEERSYVWAVSRTSLTGYELPPRSKVESMARQLHKLVSGPGSRSMIQSKSTAETQAGWKIVAASLSRMLLSPVAARLPRKRLLIVGDGALQYVPFAVLPVPGNASGVPLIVEHEIVYAPSASVVAELRREAAGRTPAPKAVAVLADPVFDKQDPRVFNKEEARVLTKGQKPDHLSATGVGEIRSWPNERLTRSATDVGLAHLSRLAFSHREADAIMAVTPAGQGKEALGFDANRVTATSPELAQYRIVHFATHALSDSRHPELSGLVLSLVDREGKAQDGFLDLQGIYNLNLPAELIVLSACQTALGKEVAGEGLMGLTRGFMYAGATRVVASLWNADDVATKDLMERFYRAMERDGMRPAAALRQAQMELWKQPRWKAPYYWAAFQLQAEWR